MYVQPVEEAGVGGLAPSPIEKLSVVVAVSYIVVVGEARMLLHWPVIAICSYKSFLPASTIPNQSLPFPLLIDSPPLRHAFPPSHIAKCMGIGNTGHDLGSDLSAGLA